MTEAEQNDENTAFESVEPYEAPEVERPIQGLINVVDAARPVPLSSSSMVNKDEIIFLNDISIRLPDEIRVVKMVTQATRRLPPPERREKGMS